MSATGEAALDQAQNFSGGLITAARRRERWQRSEANASDEETRSQFREAIADLEARYPELEEIPIGGAEAFARERGHGGGSRSPTHEGRRRPGPPRPAEPSPRPEPAASPPRPQPSSRPRRRRSLKPSSLGLRLPSGGGLFWYGALGFAALSLLYVTLRSTETPGTPAKAVPSVVNGAVNGLRRFLSLADVFPATGAPPPYAEGPGSNVAIAASRLHAAEIAHHGRRRKARR